MATAAPTKTPVKKPPESTDLTLAPGQVLWLGAEHGRLAFASPLDAHAVFWASETDDEGKPLERRIWRITIDDADEFRLVSPAPYLAPARKGR